MSVKPPSPPYVGPAAHTSAGNNMPIHRIVIHSTVSPCVPGGARDIGRYFATQAAGGSAHYITDPAEVVQDVYDSVIAWHAPPNPHSLGIEMCDIPGPVPNDKPGTAAFKAARRSWRWVQPNQQKMLRNTAKLTAQLCAAYDVPVVYLTSADLLAGKHGVTTHNNVSQAWHESTHWDPGFWPRRMFMRMVRQEYRALTDPTPEPTGPKSLSARGISHVHGKAYYYEENSLRGMRLALAKAFGIDFDIQKTKDDVLVVCHGPALLNKRRTGGFYDPLGKIRENAVVSELTWAEVSRLLSRDHKGYRIRRADDLIPRAVKAGIKVVEAEAKTPNITTGDWTRLRAKISDPSKVRVKFFPKFLPSGEHAHEAEFPTIALTHKGQTKLPASAAKWLDYFRGRKPVWVKGS